MTLITDVFPKLRTPKNIVNQISKKSPFIEPFDKQHVSGTENCWNLNQITFTIFIDHCGSNGVGKNLSYWYAKFLECFLTYWLPMTNILFLIETV